VTSELTVLNKIHSGFGTVGAAGRVWLRIELAVRVDIIYGQEPKIGSTNGIGRYM
jgi:hypothetical protein